MSLIKNSLDGLTAINDREQWNYGTIHDGWEVKAPVQLLSGKNEGLPQGGGHTSAVKLCVGGRPGTLETAVKLRKDKSYTLSWEDAQDLYHADALKERDQYSLALLHNHNAEKIKLYTTDIDWSHRVYTFTPVEDGEYYISFKGKERSDAKARGALITDVRMEVKNIIHDNGSVSLEDGDYAKSGKIVLPEGATNEKAIVFRFTDNNSGKGVNGEHMAFTLDGSGVSFEKGLTPPVLVTTDDNDSNDPGYFQLNKYWLQAGKLPGSNTLLKVRDTGNNESWTFPIEVKDHHTSHYTIDTTADKNIELDIQRDAQGYGVRVCLKDGNNPVAGKQLTVQSGSDAVNAIVSGVTDSAGYVTVVFIPHEETASPATVTVSYKTARLTFSVTVAGQYILTGPSKPVVLEMTDGARSEEIQLHLTNKQTGAAKSGGLLSIVLSDGGDEYIKASIRDKTDRNGTATLVLKPVKVTAKSIWVIVSYNATTTWKCEVTVTAGPALKYKLVMTDPATDPLLLPLCEEKALTFELLNVKDSTTVLHDQEVQAAVRSGQTTGLTFRSGDKASTKKGFVSFIVSATQSGQGTLSFTTPGAAPLVVAFIVSDSVDELSWQISPSEINLISGQTLVDAVRVGVSPATASNLPEELDWSIVRGSAADADLHILDGHGVKALKGSIRFDARHQAHLGALIAGNKLTHCFIELNARGLPAARVPVNAILPEVTVTHQGDKNNPISLPEGQEIPAATLRQDYVLVSTTGNNGSRRMLSNVQMHFRINESDDADIATFDKARHVIEATVLSDDLGRVFLPGLFLKNGLSGNFSIDIYAPWYKSPVGTFYFTAAPFVPIRAIAFPPAVHHQNVRFLANRSEEQNADLYVEAYIDKEMVTKASYGSVTFTIISSPAGCLFTGGKLTAVASVGLNGHVRCPPITTGPYDASHNSFSLLASVTTPGGVSDTVTIDIIEND